MTKLERILEDRKVSGFNVSIGTGIALETLFPPTHTVYDPSREVSLYNGGFSTYSINIHTLVRNVFNALDSTEKVYVLKQNSIQAITDIVFREVDIINNLLDSNNKRLEVVKPDVRLLRTFLQHKSGISQSDMIKEFSFLVEKEFELDIFRGGSDKIITSHITTDLLRKGEFKLLESHTGKIINRLKFNKRYTKTKGIDTSILPFNYLLLKIYGDGSKYIKSYPISMRREVYETLVTKGVNPLQTEEWVKRRIKGIIE